MKEEKESVVLNYPDPLCLVTTPSLAILSSDNCINQQKGSLNSDYKREVYSEMWN